MAFCSNSIPDEFLLSGQYAMSKLSVKPRPFLDEATMVSNAMQPGEITLATEKTTQFRSFALVAPLLIGTTTVTLPLNIAGLMQSGDTFVVNLEKFNILSVVPLTGVATITRATDGTIEADHAIGDVVFYLGQALDQGCYDRTCVDVEGSLIKTTLQRIVDCACVTRNDLQVPNMLSTDIWTSKRRQAVEKTLDSVANVMRHGVYSFNGYNAANTTKGIRQQLIEGQGIVVNKAGGALTVADVKALFLDLEYTSTNTIWMNNIYREAFVNLLKDAGCSCQSIQPTGANATIGYAVTSVIAPDGKTYNLMFDKVFGKEIYFTYQPDNQIGFQNNQNGSKLYLLKDNEASRTCTDSEGEENLETVYAVVLLNPSEKALITNFTL